MTYTPTSTGKEAKQYHHPDRVGTQLVTTGASSSFRQTTFPFGTMSAETTGNSNQVFTLYDRSSTTGLDYAVNRTYSKGQGRFTQVDPIAMASASIGNPQSNNLYAYVQNMPTDFVDPSGLQMVAQRRCRNAVRFYYVNGSLDSVGVAEVCETVMVWMEEGIGYQGGLPDWARSVYRGKMGKKLTDCINSVFSKVVTGLNRVSATGANLLKPQTIRNAPNVDLQFDSNTLGRIANNGRPSAGAVFRGDEYIGPNGTVRIANDLSWSPGLSLVELYQRTYVHELGNLLSRKISGFGQTFGDPNGVRNEGGGDPDFDTGANLERCVFGNVKG